MRVGAVLAAGCAAAMVFVAGSAKAEPRTHDGFYLQLDAGLGYLSSTASSDAGGGELTFKGLSTPFALMLGGTVGPVVIGGGFFADYAPSPSAEIEGSSLDLGDVSLTLFGVGLFADYYVDPHGGLHIQPFLGFGGLEASRDGDSGGSDPTGPVFALGVGYDFWVADEWSIGVMGRFAYAPLKLDDTSFNTIAPAVLATFTYH